MQEFRNDCENCTSFHFVTLGSPRQRMKVGRVEAVPRVQLYRYGPAGRTPGCATALHSPVFTKLVIGLGRIRPSCRRHLYGRNPVTAKTDANAEPSSTDSAQPSAERTNLKTQPERSQNAQRRSRSPRKSGPSWLNVALRVTNGFIFNAIAVFLLMRLWPKDGGGGGGAQLPLGMPADAITLRVGYSHFLRSVKKNEIQRLAVDGTTLSFQMRPSSEFLRSMPKELDPARLTFQTIRPADLQTPYDTLLANGVDFSAVDRRAGGGVLGNVLGYGIILLLLIAVFSRMPANMRFSVRGGAKRHSQGRTADSRDVVTFDDVAGVDEAKEELQEVVEYLKDPDRFLKLGARPPSGVLLVGPPGTGKTLLARAVAGEAGVPFFSIAASEFVELYVGMGALRVRELFAQARKEAPAIVFIDEIDAVAKGRDSRLRSVGNDEREQTLNQLLTELDGFDKAYKEDQTVICIAATNRPDVLDSALLRPGRFDRRVAVERPDRIGRHEILKVHVERKELPLGGDVDIESLAALTVGFTGADLANVVNEAALLAGRESRSEVTSADFNAAVLRAIAGIEKKRSLVRGIEKRVIAEHEAGHAIVSTAAAILVPAVGRVQRLSIVPRSGGALGFTYSTPDGENGEDRVLMFENEIRGQLAVLMGGRAAELEGGEEGWRQGGVSTGAIDDLKRATELAHRMVAEYGMSKTVGPVSVAGLTGGADSYSLVAIENSGVVGRAVEVEVRRLCETALRVAQDAVTYNKDIHVALARLLELEERLDGEVLQRALDGVRVPDSMEQFIFHDIGESEQHVIDLELAGER